MVKQGKKPWLEMLNILEGSSCHMKEIQVKERILLSLGKYCYKKEITVIVRKFILQEGNHVKGNTFMFQEGNLYYKK